MTDFFSSPVGMALLAGCCTWAFTAFGAGMVYTAKSFSRRTLDVMLGFAAGVMIAASYWSLLAPALEMRSHLGRLACVPVALGFLAGAGVLRLVDLILPHIHPTENVPDGPPSKLPRSALLVFAITLHNIPEGLAVGVAFGAAASGAPEASIAGAMTLMFGMGLQNIPEGVAVSVPLLREGFSKNRAFFFGQLSGIVEPIAAVFGALVVGIAEPILPFALAFAAGAMIFVVVEEVIPESHASGHGDAASLGVIIGFVGALLGVGLGLLVLEYRMQIQGFLAGIGFDPFPVAFHGTANIPVVIDWAELAWQAVKAFVMVVVASIIPALITARQDPARSLRSM